MKSRKAALKVTSKSPVSSSGKDPRPSGPTEEQIRFRAYEIYVERGRVDGLDREDWFQAEKELTEIIHMRQSA